MTSRSRVPRRRVWAVAAACGAVAVGGLTAWATIPDASGVITGCYATSTGALRVIDTERGQRCRPGERRLTWNQRGLQGLPGADGTTGARGPAGEQGPPGAAIEHRLRSSGVTVLPPYTRDDPPQFVPVAMLSSAWAQAAGEIHLLFGEVAFSASTCTQSPSSTIPPQIRLRILIDGNPVIPDPGSYFAEVLVGTAGANRSQFVLPRYLFERAASQTHAITVEAANNGCTGADEAITIAEVAIDVAVLK